MDNHKYPTAGLAISFFFVLSLLAGLGLFGLSNLESINQHLNIITGEIQSKIILTVKMRQAARERTLNLQQILLIEDAFERDELWMNFNSNGAKFAEARLLLLNMNLSPEEHAFINEQGLITTTTANIQMKVAQLALEGKSREATELLTTQALPFQEKVFYILDNLYTYYESRLKFETEHANAAYNNVVRVSWFVGVLALFSGAVVAVFTVMRMNKMQKQITLKQVEVSERQRFFRNVLNDMQTLVAVLEPDGKVIFVNKTPLAKIGLNEDIVGTLFYDNPLWADKLESRTGIYNGIFHAATGKIYREDIQVQTDHGSMWLELGIHPVFSQDGQIQYLVPECRDITSRVRIEDMLRRTQKMEAIGQLSGGIAHDFNNQLGVVIGYLDILKDYAKDQGNAVTEWVETATHATLRCMELTRQLLVFSRHQAKRKEAVNINNLISTMQTMIARSVIPEVKVQYRLEQNLWASLIDPGEFQDAVLNLVLNSRDAMPSGGSLIIETLNKNIDLAANTHIPDMNPGEYILFSVTDTGTGLSAEVKERIFEPFFTTKPVGKGTGLGLAMVYGFAKRYDGFVNVESEENNGASIHIYLPRYIQTDASAKKDIIEEILPTGTETILIVDDEPDLLSLADRYLTSLGYNTIMTSDATSALEILSKNSEIALLFTDIVMPDVMNGYDLAEKAKACNPGIKILLTSGYAQDSEDSARLSSLIVNLLPKPYRKADLAHQIRTILDKPVSD